jgi:hypothetical protein
VPRKSARRRSASTPKHESASLARQQPRESREVTRQVNLPEGRVKAAVEETANQDRAMSSHLHGRQHLVDASCSMRPIRPSPGQSMYKEGKRVAAAQAVAQARLASKKSLFENLKGLQEVGVEDSRAEAIMVLWLALHESSYFSR